MSALDLESTLKKLKLRIKELEQLENRPFLDNRDRDLRVLDSVSDAMVMTNMEFRIQSWNRGAEEIYGWSASEVLGKNIRDVIHMEYLDETRESVLKTFYKTGCYVGKTLDTRKDSTKITIWASVNMIKDSAGNPVGILSINRELDQLQTRQNILENIIESNREVVQQQVKELALLHAELQSEIVRRKNMLEVIPDLLFLLDADGRIIDFKPSASMFLFTSPEDFLGHLLEKTLPPEICKNTRAAMASLREGQQQVTFEYKLSEDQIEKTFESRMVRSKADEFVALIRDVSELKQAENERIKLQKLESIGVLAGGIAHDFNNILTGVLGYIQLAKRFTGDTPERTLSALSGAEKAIHRASSLTSRLLTFSKGGAPVRVSADISKLLQESIDIALSGQSVRAEISKPVDLWFADIDPTQIIQVFNNILINSSQAMPKGGTVFIHLENIYEQDMNLMQRCIKISIRDEGNGIPSKVLSKIFDPYFTTKSDGNGLGLAIAYSIVHRHGGKIRVVESSDKGTTIEVLILACENTRDCSETAEDLVVEQALKILVMDDEDLILDALSEMLTELGHNVTTAKDGVSAIENYKQAISSGQPFQFVILDLTIQGGEGGMAVFKRMLKLPSTAFFVVSSGYSSDPIMADPVKHGFHAGLKKPYSMRDLNELLLTAIRKNPDV